MASFAGKQRKPTSKVCESRTPKPALEGSARGPLTWTMPPPTTDKQASVVWERSSYDATRQLANASGPNATP